MTLQKCTVDERAPHIMTCVAADGASVTFTCPRSQKAFADHVGMLGPPIETVVRCGVIATDPQPWRPTVNDVAAAASATFAVGVIAGLLLHRLRRR